jgi:hypothetical protein
MSFRLYEATLRRNGRDVDPGRVAPFLLGADLDDTGQAPVTDQRLYLALEAAAKRCGCSDLRRDLPEYELQLRERGSRDVKVTYASHWREVR